MAVEPHISSLPSELESVCARSINSSPPAPIVFDCDGTIIAGDVGEAMLYYQLRHFLFRVSPAVVWRDHPERDTLSKLFDTLLATHPEERTSSPHFVPFVEMVLTWYFNQLAEGKTAKGCADIVRLCAGFSQEEVREIAHRTLREELAAPLSTTSLGRFQLPRGIRYIAETKKALKRFLSAGCDVWIVSGSNRWAVEAVCERYGIPVSKIIGIRLAEDNGVLQPAIAGAIPVLEGKIAALHEAGAGKPGAVFSDSIYDIPLFEYSTGKRILINSRNGTSSEFFATGKVKRDHTWIVVESPTMITEEG